jgi:hypothetical protein
MTEALNFSQPIPSSPSPSAPMSRMHWHREQFSLTNAFEICETQDLKRQSEMMKKNAQLLIEEEEGVEGVEGVDEDDEKKMNTFYVNKEKSSFSAAIDSTERDDDDDDDDDDGNRANNEDNDGLMITKKERERREFAAVFGKCQAVDCEGVCTAQGYLCKFHRVAKKIALKSDWSGTVKEDARWCHYCKKVQKVSDFTEESGTLCHAKYLLRRQRSEEKRARKKASPEEDNNNNNNDDNSNNNNIKIDNNIDMCMPVFNDTDLLLMSPENPFFAAILDDNFLKPLIDEGSSKNVGNGREEAKQIINDDDDDNNNDNNNWNSRFEITKHRLRVDYHPSELMSNNNKAIWNDLTKAGLLSDDEEEIEYAQIAPGSTILSWQVFRKAHNNSPRRGQISADRIHDTLTENDISRGKPVFNDSQSILQNFISYSGFRSRGHQTGIYARRSRENDSSLEVFKTNRAYVEWAEESLVPLVAVIGRPFIVRVGSDFYENEITAVRAYGAFGSLKISAEDFASNGIVKFPADTFKSMLPKKMTGGGLFWVQFETADDRCSAPKAALILPDLQTAVDTHIALRNLRNENAMRSAIEDIGSVLLFSESGYLYEEEMYNLLRDVIRQCECSPPFQQHAKSLITVLKSVEDDIKAQREEIVRSQQEVVVASRSRKKNKINSFSNNSHAKCISEAEPYFAFCANVREYELSERFDAWYADDYNEFRFNNRKGMLGYGILMYSLAFLAHFFRFCVIFNVSRFWAILSNLPTFYFIHRWIFGSGLGPLATPLKMTLGMFWTFFWYGRVVYLYIDGGEHSDRLKFILLGCYFGASTLAFGALKTRDAIVGPLLLRTTISYEEIYAHVYGIITNEGEFFAHARKLFSDHLAIVFASTFGALYIQSVAKSLAYKRCESIVRESRKMNIANKKAI